MVISAEEAGEMTVVTVARANSSGDPWRCGEPGLPALRSEPRLADRPPIEIDGLTGTTGLTHA